MDFKDLSIFEKRKKIKEKFGSVAEFAAKAGLNFNKLSAYLRGWENIEQCFKDDVNLKFEELNLPDLRGEDILRAIKAKYLKAINFCQENPEFSQAYISVLCKKSVVNRTSKVNRLLSIINEKQIS